MKTVLCIIQIQGAFLNLKGGKKCFTGEFKSLLQAVTQITIDHNIWSLKKNLKVFSSLTGLELTMFKDDLEFPICLLLSPDFLG